MRRADRTSNPLTSLLPILAPGRCGKRNMMFTSTFCCKSCKCCNSLTAPYRDYSRFSSGPNGRNCVLLLRGKVERLSLQLDTTNCVALPLFLCLQMYRFCLERRIETRAAQTPEGVVVFACFARACSLQQWI